MAVVRGIHLMTLLRSEDDRKFPVDDRVYGKADGLTQHDHSWEMPLMAKTRGFSRKYLLFDTRNASMANLKRVRDHRQRGLTPAARADDRISRASDALAIPAEETGVHLRGYGMVEVFRIDAPDGDAESWVADDLAMDAGMRRLDAEVRFAIEDDHRELKRNRGVERCQTLSERSRRNPIGLALRAFPRLEGHFDTPGLGGFEAKLRLVRDAVRGYLRQPVISLPRQSRA